MSFRDRSYPALAVRTPIASQRQTGACHGLARSRLSPAPWVASWRASARPNTGSRTWMPPSPSGRRNVGDASQRTVPAGCREELRRHTRPMIIGRTLIPVATDTRQYEFRGFRARQRARIASRMSAQDAGLGPVNDRRHHLLPASTLRRCIFPLCSAAAVDALRDEACRVISEASRTWLHVGNNGAVAESF